MTALQPRTREAVLQIAAWQLGVLESPAGSNAVKYNEAFYGRRVAGSDANGGAVQRRRRRPGLVTGACRPRYNLS